MSDYALFVTAPLHLESLLAEELHALGIDQAQETRGGVSFSGTLEEAYRVCLWSRVANRVLLELASFTADSPEALYRGVQQIDWRDHFGVANTFAVQFQSSQSTITHSQYGALKAKDAVVDQFRDRDGERPSIDTGWPDVRINVYVHRNQASVSLDLSGDSLHRRGYRRAGGAAPLKENLAAAILLRAGWPAVAQEQGTLLDPMCGSGTLLIEGAWIAGDIAPGLLRGYWGFSGWRQHQPALWQKLYDEAQQRREQGLARLPQLVGYDIDERAIDGARQNVQAAGLDNAIDLHCQSLQQLQPDPELKPGLVIVNPPYGERLGSDSDLPLVYQQLGQTLKQQFSGWQVALFTGNPELTGQLQLRSLRRHSLYNGPIECKLFHYKVDNKHDITPRGYPRPLTPAEFTDNARMLANRLQKNLKQLSRWLARENIHCYRLYDADMPEYALAIDVYDEEQRRVHVQEYAPPRSVDSARARQRLREALGVILDTLQIDEQQLFFKVRQRQKGTAQYEKLAEQRHFYPVTENGCRFWVNFEDYLDTGLFLDHRLVRARLGELASGGDFLNLFAYTGTATVYAAHGGARSTTTIDMSKTYLDWARRNMELNSMNSSEHRFIQRDCLEWLQQEVTAPQYDLIFLDPPSFSTSKRMQTNLDIQRDHVWLIRQCMKRLRKDGILLFSTNLRNFKLDEEALATLEITDIHRQTLPRDFERNPKIHHCWEFRHRHKPVLSLK
ncbi:MAG: bifunctional 23S rRNA (guanine(2069)-N(7))-methyltransferase RlmK/23S rRNA (guanine(2445)-N(2))-methyltransferase RlmL [Thiohalophilus sp.]|uniref:bifunctional 23S rRNA (guanine(2069)-N(7))-methyltransferase RlmK/23S rRNA (guanine(2445)-N(2))-methyltransferase RlmL n=1 Tax=Thiohalophilus sp. TaxID=3028392 RepID=UPI002870523B|nr:bifunctional 23S rRNA (guanine(2069)-N(7))-methyltransferase RlmK/23S rRNA (guanine(2445)-N(2))-methyltransferase RlmL [Thiohalophilus sp.]MDR9436298.1 bifunctional 23S rRNA (guanine(2069)-N(7))-methyltransferase RlmK/23S rRNA (guanine(2445)-N(2))-methyltransferase RlmL [Thiohalophilus sp.]